MVARTPWLRLHLRCQAGRQGSLTRVGEDIGEVEAVVEVVVEVSITVTEDMAGEAVEEVGECRELVGEVVVVVVVVEGGGGEVEAVAVATRVEVIAGEEGKVSGTE